MGYLLCENLSPRTFINLPKLVTLLIMEIDKRTYLKSAVTLKMHFKQFVCTVLI